MNDFSRLVIGGVASFPEVKRTPNHTTPMNTAPITKASVEYTVQEADALINLIDVAVKTLGLKNGAAETGVFLAKKLNAAFTPPKENNVLQQLPPVGE